MSKDFARVLYVSWCCFCILFLYYHNRFEMWHLVQLPLGLLASCTLAHVIDMLPVLQRSFSVPCSLEWLPDETPAQPCAGVATRCEGVLEIADGALERAVAAYVHRRRMQVHRDAHGYERQAIFNTVLN